MHESISGQDQMKQEALNAAERNAKLNIDPKTGLVYNSLAEQIQAETERMGATGDLSAIDLKASADIITESAKAATERNARLAIDPKTGLVFNPETDQQK
ncbi:MAG: hypothetical protein Q7R54_02585 [bacterium]|nr:hypothetical protein [bacterium]